MFSCSLITIAVNIWQSYKVFYSGCIVICRPFDGRPLRFSFAIRVTLSKNISWQRKARSTLPIFVSENSAVIVIVVALSWVVTKKIWCAHFHKYAILFFYFHLSDKDKQNVLTCQGAKTELEKARLRKLVVEWGKVEGRPWRVVAGTIKSLKILISLHCGQTSSNSI